MAKYSNIGKILFHDIFNNNPYDGYIIFYTKYNEWDSTKNKHNEIMKKIFYCKASEVSTFLDNFSVNKEYNYYYTLNSYKNSKGKEKIPSNKTCNLFGINGIVIDLDCHYKNRLIENDFIDIITKIDNYTSKYKLPNYNYIIKTGRGLQIYYLIKPCSYKLQFLVNIAKDKLIEHYKRILVSMPQFKIDAAASKRYSGLYRMPYTVNQNANVEATISRWDVLEKKDINDFLDCILLSFDNLKINHSINKNSNKATYIKNDKNPPNVRRCQKVLIEIEKYQLDKINNNSQHENRNRTCLIYTSFLLNLYLKEEALKKLKIFNNRYNNCIFREICASVPKERSAIPLETERSSAD